MIVKDVAWKKDYWFTMVFVAHATMNYSWCFGKDSSSDSQLNNGDRSVTARKGLASQKTKLFVCVYAGVQTYRLNDVQVGAKPVKKDVLRHITHTQGEKK